MYSLVTWPFASGLGVYNSERQAPGGEGQEGHTVRISGSGPTVDNF